MNDVLWEIEPHTIAKHKILDRYLGGWLGKFLNAKNYQVILYVDGFAGPGEYLGGEKGSPQIFMDKLVSFLDKNIQKKKVYVFFIEKDTRRCNHLMKLILNKYKNYLEDKSILDIEIKFINDDFQNVLNKILPIAERDSLIPSLFFIDPFGYKELKMDALRTLIKPKHVELLITFMSSFFRYHIRDPDYEDTMKRVFGDDSYKDIEDEVKLVDIFANNIIKGYEDAYTLTFEMLNKQNTPLYHLVYVTRHIEGMRVMKESMWKVDPTGSFRFYDRYAGIAKLTSFIEEKESMWIKEAAEMVYKMLKGKKVKIREIEEFVLLRTPYRFRKGILKYLEGENKIKVETPKERRRGSFPDDSIISFY